MLQKKAVQAPRERNSWNKAISASDSHSRKCRRCYSKPMPISTARDTGLLNSLDYDPYPICKKAEELHRAEVAAMNAYRTAGGLLPCH